VPDLGHVHLPRLKKYTSIFLLIVLSAPQLLRLEIIRQWKANQAYITANFCENRAKPALKCDGKCYLRKQLAQSGTEESPASPAPAQKNQVQKSYEYAPFLLPEVQEWVCASPADVLTGGPLPQVISGYHFTFITSFFQPPDRIS
jgi:hypothetical protein